MSFAGSTEAVELGDFEGYRRELTAYCYRMLASPHDADDAVQDTMVRAWRALGRLEDRAGLRPWLYKVATNVCLDMLKGRARRALPMDSAPVASDRAWQGSHQLVMGPPRPGRTWVQPIPDQMVSVADGDPAEVAVSRESVRLAFIAALQHLLPRQRAVLILRDVLRWRAEEVADLLGTSVAAVNSTLRRARSSLAAIKLGSVPTEPREVERHLLARYMEAFERYDVDALVALLHEDATLTMPPFELWLRGIGDIRRFLLSMEGEGGRDRVVPLRANGCPGLAVYRPAIPSATPEPFAIHVLEVAGDRIAAIHAFLEPELFAVFGLPAARGATVA